MQFHNFINPYLEMINTKRNTKLILMLYLFLFMSYVSSLQKQEALQFRSQINERKYIKQKLLCGQSLDLVSPYRPIDQKKHLRLLQASNPHGFRIHTDFSNFHIHQHQIPQEKINKMLLIALKFVQKLIKVTDMIPQDSIYQIDSTCGRYVNVPSGYLQGFDTSLYDSVLFVTVDPESTSVAYAGACVIRKWPTYGLIGLTPSQFDQIDDSFSFHDKIQIMLHQITHILGFSSNNYGRFYVSYDSQQLRPESQVYAANPKNSNAYLIITPRVSQYLKEYFNCTTDLPFGGHLEDSSWSVSSHWEGQVFYNDYMIASTWYPGFAITPLTLHLLSDTGFYYYVDTTLSDKPLFGKNQGCLFGYGVKQVTPQHCSPSTEQSCDHYYLHGGQCQLYWTSEQFAFVGQDYVCNQYKNQEPPFLMYGAQGHCFEYTTNETTQADIACLKSYCAQDLSEIVFQFKGANYTCNNDSFINITGIIFKCPEDFQRFCSVKSCQNQCFEQGVCVNGVCYYLDCHELIPNCINCQQNVGQQIKCSKCQSEFYLSPDKMTCSIQCASLIEFCDQCSFNSYQNVNCMSCIGETILVEGNKCLGNCNIEQCTLCKLNSTGFNECHQCIQEYEPTSNRRECKHCQETFPYCVICYKTFGCRQCDAGFYFNYNSQYCDLCQNIVSHCASCYTDSFFGTGQCNATQDGYYYDYWNSFTGVCHYTCKSCSASTNKDCKSCFQDYQLQSGQCKRSSNMTLHPETCTLYGNFIFCPAGCLQCLCVSYTNILCVTPKKGYSVDSNGKTVKCAYGCSTCDPNSPNLCLTCLSRFVMTVDGTRKCSECSPNCASCASYNLSLCSTCRQGFGRSYNTYDTTCLPCSKNCLICFSSSSDTLQCKACMLGNYYNQTEKACISCLEKCQTCDSSDPTYCNSCFHGFWLTSGRCQVCAYGCLDCMDQNTCAKCLPQFRFDQNGTCIFKPLYPCLQSQAEAPQNCTKCAFGYSLDQVKKYCQPILYCQSNCNICPLGTKKNGSVCQKCALSGCIKCQQNTLICQDCAPGYFFNQNYCLRCSQKCKICINFQFCIQCAIGYTTINALSTKLLFPLGGICEKCEYPCRTCYKQTRLCTSCLAGLILVKGTCMNSLNIHFQLVLEVDFNYFVNRSQPQQLKKILVQFLTIPDSLFYYQRIYSGSTVIKAIIFAPISFVSTRQTSQENICTQANHLNQLISENRLLDYNIIRSAVSVSQVPNCKIANLNQNSTIEESGEQNSRQIQQFTTFQVPFFVVLALLIVTVVGIVIYVILKCFLKKKIANIGQSQQKVFESSQIQYYDTSIANTKFIQNYQNHSFGELRGAKEIENNQLPIESSNREQQSEVKHIKKTKKGRKRLENKTKIQVVKNQSIEERQQPSKTIEKQQADQQLPQKKEDFEFLNQNQESMRQQ